MLLCGRSFSGKSTLARALAGALPCVVVSLDAINDERGLHGGEGIPIKEWAHTMDIAHQRVSAALGEDSTVLVDDTSSPRFLRDAWRELAAAHNAPVILVFIDAPPSVVLSRQAANRATPRRRDVQDAVMRSHLETFKAPDDHETPIRVPAENVLSPHVIDQITQAITIVTPPRIPGP